MDGIIVIDKPQGWTSFDVVAKIRSLSKIKKVGHAGTLDPMATGVLVLLLGKATKLAATLTNGDKTYAGAMVLGISTDTFDREGKVTATSQVSMNIDKDAVEKVFAEFTGSIKQVPPMFSAKKQNGVRLYDLARKDIVVHREPVDVVIHELRLTEFIPGQNPAIKFLCKCSKGTYIRALASDIGEKLGCGAHLSELRRVASYPYTIESAFTMDDAVKLIKAGELGKMIIDPAS